MPTLTCMYCGGRYEAARTSSKFCKPAHRAAYNRAIKSKKPTFASTEPQEVFAERNRDRLKRLMEFSLDCFDILIAIAGEKGVETAEDALDAAWAVYLNHDKLWNRFSKW